MNNFQFAPEPAQMRTMGGVARAPEGVEAIVAAWNKSARAHGAPMATAKLHVRPNGLQGVVQISMQGVGSMGLGASDDATVRAAIKHLYATQNQGAPPPFDF